MAFTVEGNFRLGRKVIARIVAVSVACAAAATLYALLAPKWYRSTLSVVATKQQKSGLSGLLAAAPGALGASLDAVSGASADVARIAAVLHTDAVTDAVIARHGLRERYDETVQEQLRRMFWQHCEAAVQAKPGIVEVSCEDKDPEFAQALLRSLAEFGNHLFTSVSESSAAEEVRFLEKRVAELRANADETSARMQRFQEAHGIIDLDTQSKAVVGTLSVLNAQRTKKQLELAYARTYSSPDESTLVQLQAQLAVLDNKIRSLMAPKPADGRPSTRRVGTTFPSALAVPELRAEYDGLLRDRKISEASLVFAMDRLESARASRARDVSTFVVLDPPTRPTRHSRPNRGVIIVGAALLGAAGALGFEWCRARGVLAIALALARPTGP